MPMPGVVAAGRVVIVIIAATTLAACRAPGAIASGSPDGGSPIVATATVTSGSTRLPVDIPDAFPVFPGAAPALPPADPDVLARWLTDANGADVYDFYVDALPRAGFEIELLAPGGAAAVISFRPADGPLFDLAFTAKEGGTQIDLRVPGP